jgi:long-chain acyl-CoA synthetase
MLVAQANAFNAVPICTAYDSLGPDGLKHSLNETEVRSMFTNAELLPILAKVIGDAPSVKVIVYDGEGDKSVIDKITSAREGIKVIHLDEVIKLGKAKPVEAIQAKREDVYCCMYTSGSSRFEMRWQLMYSRYAKGSPDYARQCGLCK